MFRVNNVPMFRDLAPKMDPCLGILLQKQFWFFFIFRKFLKNGPMFRDFGVKNGTHVYGFFVKNQPIWAAHPRIAFLWEYPLPGGCDML